MQLLSERGDHVWILDWTLAITGDPGGRTVLELIWLFKRLRCPTLRVRRFGIRPVPHMPRHGAPIHISQQNENKGQKAHSGRAHSVFWSWAHNSGHLRPNASHNGASSLEVCVGGGIFCAECPGSVAARPVASGSDRLPTDRRPVKSAASCCPAPLKVARGISRCDDALHQICVRARAPVLPSGFLRRAFSASCVALPPAGVGPVARHFVVICFGSCSPGTPRTSGWKLRSRAHAIKAKFTARLRVRFLS